MAEIEGLLEMALDLPDEPPVLAQGPPEPEIPSPTRDEALAKAAEVKPPAQTPVEEEGGVKGQAEHPLTLPTPCRSESAPCLVPTLPSSQSKCDPTKDC